MVGRKPKVSPSECIAAVMNFKERVVIDNERKKGKYLLLIYYAIACI